MALSMSIVSLELAAVIVSSTTVQERLSLWLLLPAWAVPVLELGNSPLTCCSLSVKERLAVGWFDVAPMNLELSTLAFACLDNLCLMQSLETLEPAACAFCHDSGFETTMRGNIHSLSVAEHSVPAEVVVELDVDVAEEELVEVMESRHGSHASPLARKSLLNMTVRGDGRTAL